MGILTINYMSISGTCRIWHEFFICFAKEIHVLEVKAIKGVSFTVFDVRERSFAAFLDRTNRVLKTDFSFNQMYVMKLILAIPAAGLLLSGTLRSLQHSDASALSSQPIAPAASTTEVKAKPKMWTEKEYLYKGESFDLHFDLPHARYLGMVDPDGKFFYVVFPAESAVGKLTPLVTSEQFVSMRSLKINTQNFKADPYIYGVLENQPVFNKSGTYRVVLGEDLHTDDESSLTVIRIQYVNAKRPSGQNTSIASLRKILQFTTT